MSRKEETINFKEIYRTYFNSLVNFTQRFIGEYDASVDIVQETFISLWNRGEELSEVESVKSFLYTTARNKSLNHLRHLKIRDKYYQEELLEKENNVFYEHSLIEEETYRLIIKVIQENLNEQCQKVLKLSLKGAKNHEVADLLHISVNTVKYHKKNAYKVLKLKLQDIYLWGAFIYLFTRS
ncbi:RNA polymerase sigma-70 factor [Solitalea canadensis]|uniref:RNA polymerase sigma-70 factor n=1 Tax=Solitalea canadensis TaxID=995 RepID=UPI0012F87FF8|nr:RNA polymerase sigma-70 factor [Solitalea canadensis]